MDQLREKGLDADFLAVMMYVVGDPLQDESRSFALPGSREPQNDSAVLDGEQDLLPAKGQISSSGVVLASAVC